MKMESGIKKLTGILLIVFLMTSMTGFIGDSGSAKDLLSFFTGDHSSKRAELVSGTEFSTTIHELAGDDYNFHYYYQFGYDPKQEPSHIRFFSRASHMSLIQRQKAEIVSTDSSDYPVYVWYEENTLYYYSKAGTILLNKNAAGMFYHLSVKSLDVSDFDTRKVRDLYGMFMECRRLQSVDVSGWDTSKVKDMSRVFNYCSRLKTLDLSHWNTSRVQKMESMFGACRSLVKVKLSGWNTAKTVDFLHMFSGCCSLESVNFSKWNTSGVLEMTGMFANCRSLSSRSIHSCDNWDCSEVRTSGFFRMFRNVESGHPDWKGSWDHEGTFTPAETSSE